MDDDQFFRWFLVAAMVVLMPVGAYHRIRAAASKEPIDRREEGWGIFLGIRLTALFHYVGVFAFVIEPPSMGWSAVPLPPAVRWIGVVAGALSVLLFVWTFRTLGPNLTDTVVTRRAAYLVTNGPYRWVRHPFYVAFGLALVGDSLVAANWFLAVTGAIIMLSIWLRTGIEEGKLVEKFGDDYRKYQARTGRFWPRFGRV